MTSMFTFIKSKKFFQSKVEGRLHPLFLGINALLHFGDDPAWRLALSIFLAARIVLSAWAFAVSALIPLAVSNLDLHGEPVVTMFDLRTSTRAVFSRVLDGKELHFRAAYPNLMDLETNSLWDTSGRAVSGERTGAQLSASKYSAEEVFPYRGVAPTPNTLLAPWQRFDANWYLKIAQRGYGDDGSSVYFPLYPFLIRIIGNLLLGNELLGAILISNLAVVGVLYFFYQMALELSDASSAKRATAFLMIFPTAFFLLAPYTESFFVLCALASLHEARHARWGRAGVWGACAALARLQGALLIVPLAYLAWREFRRGENAATFYVLRFTSLLLIPFATLAFFAFTHASLLNAYESQLHARFVMPWENVGAAIALIANAHASLIDILNLLVTFFFGAIVILVWARLPRELGLYAAMMFLAPLFRMTTEQPLVSMFRYVLVIFPAFILFGRWSANAWAQRATVYLSIPLQLFLSAQFFLWGWVA